MTRRREHFDDLDDRALVASARAGDERAFGELYIRYFPRILSFCRQRVHHLPDAEDAAQETFLRARRALTRGGEVVHPGAWLRAIAANLCIDQLQDRYRSFGEVGIDRADPESVVGPEEAVVAAEQSITLDRALARISARHRRVLELRERSGLSYEEIARVSDLELGAAKALIFRAREALRREYFLLTTEDVRLARSIALPSTLRRRLAISLPVGAADGHRGDAAPAGSLYRGRLLN